MHNSYSFNVASMGIISKYLQFVLKLVQYRIGCAKTTFCHRHKLRQNQLLKKLRQNGQRSTVNCQRSTVNCQRSTGFGVAFAKSHLLKAIC